MRGGEHAMSTPVDKVSFADGVGPPEHEYDSVSLRGEMANGCVGESFPPQTGMRFGGMFPHRERRVEQKHPLTRPAGEVAVGGYRLLTSLKMLTSDGGIPTPGLTEKLSPLACPGP